ncbi:inactive tyrosine-protein kinase transmembrane receptor ROR1-like isoform X4 [Mytilus edulis]|uniref:inactive tyrosine-protein kinase transmembrane receptor ROR1-like isoform X4 n=1 Tax=Mytilus edulis TaxID=6550 RepID=UPI0039EE814C
MDLKKSQHLVIGLCFILVLQVYGQMEKRADISDESYRQTDSSQDFFGTNDRDGIGGQPTLNVDFEMKNTTKYKGEIVRLRCEISGNPLPKYSWFKDSIEIGDKEDRFNVKLTPWGSRLKIEKSVPHDSGYYMCIAANRAGAKNATAYLQIKNEHPPKKDNKGGGSKTDVDSSFPDLGDDTDRFSGKYDPEIYKKLKEESSGSTKDDSNGFCQPFRGNMCARFIGNQTIYVNSEYAQGVKEEKFIAAFTVIAASSDMSAECQKYAIEFLCFYTFPLCDRQHINPTPRKVCRDECEMLEGTICKKEYVIGRHHPMIGEGFLPKCYDLPPRGTPEGDKCKGINVPIDPTQRPEVHTCYGGNGMKYKGSINHSRSGRPCMNWKNNPHFKGSEYPDLGNHHLCRNPNGTYTGPWCYTDPSYHHTELCDIPKCVGAGPGQGAIGAEPVNKLMYLVPGIIVPLALIILLAIACLCQRHKKQKDAGVKTKVDQPATNMETVPLKSAMNVRDFPISSIRFLQELGEGQFGKVFKGEVLGLYGDNMISKVAIKTLKENSLPKVKNDFRREVDLMSELRHGNIVCLLGVCMKQEPMCMLFEYMQLGDLHEYLVTHSPNSDVGLSNESEGLKHALEYGDLLHIATQIVAGMEYLSSHHYVHRDLAARNILVGDNMCVKISDFGLSRDIYSQDYYRVQSKSILPVRWMPPEAILYGKFTTETDIWSFGVVMWEIFSFGLQPYYGYSNPEVIEVVRARQILPSPEECPTRVYGLMVECWHEVPNRRPTFREIHARLRAWKTEVLMLNPHWSLSQSHSAHSGSTHQSSQSGPSHHSSTGPSNTTALTGLTGSSGGSDPSSTMSHPGMIGHPGMVHPGMGQPPPNYQDSTRVHYYPNLGPQQMQQYPGQGPILMQRGPPPNQMPNHNGPSKLSPAGSIASSKQSSSSGASSNYKPNVSNCNTLTGPATIDVSECQKFSNLMSQNSYIPEQRTVDYNEC